MPDPLRGTASLELESGEYITRKHLVRPQSKTFLFFGSDYKGGLRRQFFIFTSKAVSQRRCSA